MSEAWRKLFTPVDELPPSDQTMIEISNLDGYVDDTFFERRGPCKADTALALAEFVCQRKYQDSVLISEPEVIGYGIDAIYKVTALIGRRQGTGEAQNLTDAKQIAAYNLLLDIVNNDEHKKFDMVGETKEEALAYVETLNPQKTVPIKQKAVATPVENWIGQCTTLCDHKDLKSQPKYECDNGIGPPHNRIFTCIATLPGHPTVKVEATGPTIKSAKSEAARLLKPLLEALPEGPDAEVKRQKRLARQQKQNELNESNSITFQCVSNSENQLEESKEDLTKEDL